MIHQPTGWGGSTVRASADSAVAFIARGCGGAPRAPPVAAPSREACGASSSCCPEILSCTPIGMGSRARVHAGLAGRRRPMHRLRRPSRAVGPEIGEKEERRDVTLTCGSLTPTQLVTPDQSATPAKPSSESNYLGARGKFGPYLRE